MKTEFEDLTMAELKEMYELTTEAFERKMEQDCYYNELYNDDGEYDIKKFLKEL